MAAKKKSAKKAKKVVDTSKLCLDCGKQVKNVDDICAYCGGPLHPDAPQGKRGRCTSNHEADCEDNPDNQLDIEDYDEELEREKDRDFGADGWEDDD
jgi:hypothetical protein